jgi:hypothetical protein
MVLMGNLIVKLYRTPYLTVSKKFILKGIVTAAIVPRI